MHDSPLNNMPASPQPWSMPKWVGNLALLVSFPLFAVAGLGLSMAALWWTSDGFKSEPGLAEMAALGALPLLIVTPFASVVSLTGRRSLHGVVAISVALLGTVALLGLTGVSLVSLVPRVRHGHGQLEVLVLAFLALCLGTNLVLLCVQFWVTRRVLRWRAEQELINLPLDDAT
jgi:uncharacterized membrane protein